MKPEKKFILWALALLALTILVVGVNLDGIVEVEEAEDDILIGGDSDEHGCVGTAGYLWCESKRKCLRPWVEECPVEV